jgi:hypothetical protein
VFTATGEALVDAAVLAVAMSAKGLTGTSVCADFVFCGCVCVPDRSARFFRTHCRHRFCLTEICRARYPHVVYRFISGVRPLTPYAGGQIMSFIMSALDVSVAFAEIVSLHTAASAARKSGTRPSTSLPKHLFAHSSHCQFSYFSNIRVLLCPQAPSCVRCCTDRPRPACAAA